MCVCVCVCLFGMEDSLLIPTITIVKKLTLSFWVGWGEQRLRVRTQIPKDDNKPIWGLTIAFLEIRMMHW
jgi:hypothetical protein